MKTVFISYAREDLQHAARLSALMQECRIATWLDKHDLPYGEDFPPRITLAIRDCDEFAVLDFERNIFQNISDDTAVGIAFINIFTLDHFG